MKEMFETFALGDICTSINGLWKGKKGPFVNVGVIRNANFTKDFKLDYSNIEYIDVEQRSFEKRNLQDGDLIVEKSGGSEKNPVGRAILYEGESGKYSYSNFTSVLRIKDKSQLLSKYLYNFILYRYKNGDMAAMQSHSTGIHNLDYDKYLAIQIPVPPLPEQDRIVRKLDEAFAKIDGLKQNAEKGLQTVKDLWQATMKEELKPKEGWKSFTLKDIIADITYGTSVPSCENGEYVYLRMNNITNDGRLDLKGSKTITLSEKELEKCIVRKGDILFNRTNSMELVGKSCVFDQDEPMVIAGYIIRIRLEKEYDSQFVSYCMNYMKSLGLYRNLIVGAVHQANISAKAIQTIRLSIPLLEKQQSIASKINVVFDKCRLLRENYLQEIDKYEALKQSILRKAFSGEL